MSDPGTESFDVLIGLGATPAREFTTDKLSFAGLPLSMFPSDNPTGRNWWRADVGRQSPRLSCPVDRRLSDSELPLAADIGPNFGRPATYFLASKFGFADGT